MLQLLTAGLDPLSVYRISAFSGNGEMIIELCNFKTKLRSGTRFV